MILKNDISEVGKFQKTHALKGELNALLDIYPDYIAEGNAIVVDTDGIFVPYYASSIRPKGTMSYLIKLDGIDSENEAKPFVNKAIYAIKAQLGPFLNLDEEEMMDEDDLVGYSIVDDSSDSLIGKIDSIDSSTDNLLFIVTTDDGDTVYIPAVDEFISEICDDSKVIRMNLPDGLINLNKKQDK